MGLLLFPLFLFLQFSHGDTIPSIMGGGNVGTNGDVTPTVIDMLVAIGVAGNTMCRTNLYPAGYYDDSTGLVNLKTIDSFLTNAYQHKVTPVLLFEYYNGFPNPVGPYEKWYNIGYQYAKKYMPGGTFAIQNGWDNFGISYFSAFNEPEGTNLNKTSYYYALLGLSDGVHAVNSSLKVFPGGYKAPNAQSDFTLDGFGPVLAPLWNNGSLDGIDLHTYFDYVYAPMDGTYAFSSQHDFDMVKKVNGITRDVLFATTEYNYKTYNGAWSPAVKALVTEDFAASRILTAVWDQLGVVGFDGKGVTYFAFVWNLFNNHTADPAYGLVSTLSPWTPLERGQVIQQVAALTKGMTFVAQDPKGTGVFQLAGNGKKLWVWQNRPSWSTIASTNFTIPTGLSGFHQVQVYDYRGLNRTIALSGTQSSLTVSSLGTTQTFLFLAQ